jgi:hypothetical protein
MHAGRAHNATEKGADARRTIIAEKSTRARHLHHKSRSATRVATWQTNVRRRSGSFYATCPTSPIRRLQVQSQHLWMNEDGTETLGIDLSRTSPHKVLHSSCTVAQERRVTPPSLSATTDSAPCAAMIAPPPATLRSLPLRQQIDPPARGKMQSGATPLQEWDTG